VAPGEEPPAWPAGRGGKRRALGGAVGKKLFFSPQGVDTEDDETLEPFVYQVWRQAMDELTDHEAAAADNHETPSSTERKEQ